MPNIILFWRRNNWAYGYVLAVCDSDCVSWSDSLCIFVLWLLFSSLYLHC